MNTNDNQARSILHRAPDEDSYNQNCSVPRSQKNTGDGFQTTLYSAGYARTFSTLISSLFMQQQELVQLGLDRRRRLSALCSCFF